MSGDLSHRRASYFSSCMSPSCIPIHEEYSRIETCRGGGRSSGSRKWQKMLKRIVRESKISIYGSKPTLTFQYDAVSYSQNFDEGGHGEEEHGRCPQVFREYRWHVHK